MSEQKELGLHVHIDGNTPPTPEPGNVARDNVGMPALPHIVRGKSIPQATQAANEARVTPDKDYHLYRQVKGVIFLDSTHGGFTTEPVLLETQNGFGKEIWTGSEVLTHASSPKETGSSGEIEEPWSLEWAIRESNKQVPLTKEDKRINRERRKAEKSK